MDMTQVRGLWIPIVMTVVMLAILGTFLYVSFNSPPPPKNNALIMSVQGTTSEAADYVVTVYVINHLNTTYTLHLEYFSLRTGSGDIAPDASSSSYSPVALVQGQLMVFQVGFPTPSSAPTELRYIDPDLSQIVLTLTPV